MKKVLSFVMIFVLLSGIFTQATAFELAVARSKISSDLLSEFETLGTSDTTLAYVEMQDVDHDAVMEEFARRYPEEYTVYISAKYGSASVETSPEQDELLQRAIELKRTVYREFYAALNQNVLDDYVDAESQVYVSEYAPISVLELNQSAAIDMARCDDVVSLFKYSSADDHFTANGTIMPTLDSDEVVGHLDASNQITRADNLRDTRGLSGTGVKIGILEYAGVADTTDEYLQNASITIRPGDEVVDPHATIVTLILAAVGEDGTKHGVAPDASFYCASFRNAAGTTYEINDMYSDIEWMISNGVSIINASVGQFWDGSYDEVSQWIDHIATVHDVHFVAALGNIHPQNNPNGVVSTIGMPYNAITVGGLYYNKDDEVSEYVLYADSAYIESGVDRPEKPNLIANVYFGDYKDIENGGGIVACQGTSFAAPQVAGVIAQLCCWDGNLKFRQNVVGAVLAASAAEKINFSVDDDGVEYFDTDAITGSIQISDKEGAGILDARWAWGILANENYWNIIKYGSSWSLDENGRKIFHQQTITINTNVHTLTRVAIFWTKNNKDINHTTNELGDNNPDLTNFDLYVYDSSGNVVCQSTTEYSNFEIVQFIPEAPGIYTIVIVLNGTSSTREYVGLAIW